MKLKGISIAVILWLGLIFHTQGLAAVLVEPCEERMIDYSFYRLRYLTLDDGITDSDKFYKFTEILGDQGPEYQGLEIHTSDNPQFEYTAHSPYYKVFFKGKTVKMTVGEAWVEFSLGEELGTDTKSEPKNLENTELASIVDQNSLSVADVFESVDLQYEVDTSLLTEILTLKERKEFERLVQRISWEGMTPEFEEDGSILFVNEEKEILKILPPFMKDAEGTVCEDLHYELVETESGYELHKIIDEKGLEWLKKAVYPVVIDPSIQTFEDAWESSGLQPYGQYFKNLKEYVNPGNGHLTVTQTDLVIPGRGIDLTISRIYETPAVFYKAEPYDYEEPPVNVGKGWQLDFPYIGEKYLHLWGGTLYKIEWVGNTFENHEGSHFILVKNGDNTYTLTTASGTVYEFSTAGKLTEIKDLDQNTITFTYNGALSSITDTIGRTIIFSYSDGRLWKIVYNGAEIEFGYDSYGCLTWMDDFLNRRTYYSYDSGWTEWVEYSPPQCMQKSNVYLLSKITYPTGGYTTYSYDRYSYEAIYGDDGTCHDYFKYYVTNQKVYETAQVRHNAYTYTGNFVGITSCTMTTKNESDVTKGSYNFTVNNGLITQNVVKNASGTPVRKYQYTYSSRKEVLEEKVYNNGSTLSYTNYYSYDDWGNTIYYKNAEGHEQFFSYANTSTSGFFVDNTGTIIKMFTNAFPNNSVPDSVHTALLGTAEKQDATYVRENYLTYDFEAHLTQSKNSFGNTTTWLTFSGTFNEKTGQTSFPIDLTGHTVAGNAVLQVTGLPSDDTYQESHSKQCHTNPTIKCTWNSGNWSGQYYNAHWMFCGGIPPECDDGWASIGPFTHYPGTLGYLSYTTNPNLGGKSNSFSVTTNWKAYAVQVKYNIDGSLWEEITSSLQNTTATIPVTITGGSHTLYFSESSSYDTKFFWYLYVPVDNTLDTYTTSMTYDIYGNVTSITDAESNTAIFTYSSSYSYAYLTEISAVVGSDTVTTKATYDYNRGWITSIQEPKGVASSGYNYLYTYDLLGRITKKEFPLLTGQSQRSYLEAVYDDTNRKVTIINQLRHYTTRHYDKLGRLTDIKQYTGQYGSGTLYATISYTYRYDNRLSTITDPGNDIYTYTYDFLGRYTQILYPDSVSVSYSYDDTNNKITFTNGRAYDRIYWYDWLSRLTKAEEEYTTDTFAVTTCNYDEIGQLASFTDAENHTTTYTYASFFGLTKIEYPDSTFEEYEYNNVGNITSFTDANGNEIVFTYDSLYRLTQIQYQDQSTVSFTYDLNSNRIRMDDDAPNTGDYVEYTYDYWNRITSEKRYISTDTYTVSYQYNEVSRLTRLTYPDTMQILYSYDDLGRTTEIKRYVDGINDEVLLENIQYDTESLLTQFDYGNSLQSTFTYDSKDRISTINVKDGETAYLDLDFTWDNNSNITQIVNGWRDTTLNWHSDTETYSYDGLDRLTSASCTSWSHTYSYDKTGNITTKDSITYTINAVDEVTALSDGTTFTYDANGNRTQKTKGSDTWAYIYDYADRLTRIEKNQTTRGEYVYDGDGKRIQATENSVTTTSIYTGLDILYEENTTGTATYIYGPKGRIAKRTMINQETNIYYYHTDQLGSTRLVTDSNRNIVTAATYHPYGETYVEEGEEEDYSFTGKQKDSTGLYYFMGRYYDPGVGRFLTRDPKLGYIDRPQTLNRYIYCLNNPLKFVDPDGRECVSILVEESRSTAARAPSTKASTEDIMNFLAILCAGLAFLYFGPIGLLLGGGAIASAFIALCYIFTAISLTLTLLTVFFDYGPEITEDFINALDNFLESESLIRDNIDDTEYHLDGTITIVINEGEDTERRVTFKKTEEGWVVVEDTGEQDGGNEGGSSNDSGGEESSSPPLPINSPTTQ